MKSLSSRTLRLEFWEERGEKLMTCHLFLDNFSWNFMTFCFSKVKSLETDFCFKKTQISQFDIMKYSSFLNFVFRKRHCNCRKLIVFSCLQFADCYMWPRILSCGVIFLCLLNHLLRNLFLWKVFLKESWCCRKHVFVFEIVSLKDLNKFDQIIFFLWLVR